MPWQISYSGMCTIAKIIRTGSSMRSLIVYEMGPKHQYFNSLASGRCGGYFINIIFDHMLGIKFMVNIGSGKGFVSLGSKSLPEPMLVQIYIRIWRH